MRHVIIRYYIIIYIVYHSGSLEQFDLEFQSHFIQNTVSRFVPAAVRENKIVNLR